MIFSGISRENAVSEKISPWFPTKTTFVTIFEIESCFRSLQIPFCQASMELMHYSSTVDLLEITSSCVYFVSYGNMGYQVYKKGIQNSMKFWPKKEANVFCE